MLALEDDEHTEMFVRGEAMLGPGFDEDSPAFLHRNLLAADFEDAGPLEDDVQLVVRVRLLAVGLRRYKAVHADFEAGGLVDDRVATARLAEPLLDGCDFECVHWGPTSRAPLAGAHGPRRRSS